MSESEAPASWSPRQRASVQRRLLAWFDAHARDLPWRTSRDPYRIWVSEVMLQQTTVTAVIPFFERFLQSFPTVQALAAADEQDVLRHWEGLGYYRRARHLHAAAKQLVAGHGGTLPNDPAVWEELPGVGRYILGAVLSQAFDRRMPIVEANTRRVLARWFAYRGDPRSSTGERWLWETAASVLPTQRVGDFNQAMMELGALVCTPVSPNCSTCPVRISCAAQKLGLQTIIPPPPAAKELVHVREVGVVIRDGEQLLLCQRPATASRWASLWEVPHGEVQPGESDEQAAQRIARELTGLTIEPREEIMTIQHGVTRWAITLVCLDAECRSGRFQPGVYEAAAWLNPVQLSDYPVSSPQRKLANELTRSGRQRRLF